jgi:hypothetical protein
MTVAHKELEEYVTLKEVTYMLILIITNGTNAIKNAIVEIAGRYMLTDESGKVLLNVPDGTYSYTISASGYEDLKGTVIISDADENIALKLITVSLPLLTKRGISIYPNPSTGIIVIDRPGSSGKMHVRLSSVDGKQVFYGEYPADRQNQIDLDQLSPGLYYIELRTADEQITSKLIIQ